LLNQDIDLSHFDAGYRNDETGAQRNADFEEFFTDHRMLPLARLQETLG
jgi:hypothetical protein